MTNLNSERKQWNKCNIYNEHLVVMVVMITLPGLVVTVIIVSSESTGRVSDECHERREV